MGRASRNKATRRSNVAAARGAGRRQLWPWLLAIVGVVVGISLVVASRGGDPPVAAPEGVEEVEVSTRNHVAEDVSYPEDPPVGGDHDPAWQTCGTYTDPVREENAVHSLEHGSVWITYQPDLAASAVKKLASAAEGETHVLLSPREDLKSPIVVSSWARQLSLRNATDPRLEQFIRAFQQAPDTPEAGAPCSGGIGTPS